MPDAPAPQGPPYRQRHPRHPYAIAVEPPALLRRDEFHKLVHCSRTLRQSLSRYRLTTGALSPSPHSSLAFFVVVSMSLMLAANERQKQAMYWNIAP